MKNIKILFTIAILFTGVNQLVAQDISNESHDNTNNQYASKIVDGVEVVDVKKILKK